VFSSPSGAAKLSLAVVAGLIGLKVAVAVITGSISIVAQATDSFLDLFAVGIAFFAITVAAKPADKEHPFGHGKVEGIAAAVQAVLIFSAAGLIIYSAMQRMITGAVVELTEAGMAVMLVSIIASLFLSRHLLRVSRATGSIALEANAHNIAADVYSAAGVLVGLLIIRFTGLSIFDPIIALMVALLILKAGYGVIRRSFGELVDTRLPQPEEESVRSAIMKHGCQIAGFHDLRTRKAGRQRYVDLHLVMPKSASVADTHRICDSLEQDIKDCLPNTSVTIHVEPGEVDCGQCSVSCTIRDRFD
jgi:cation diffusion facilitator family transporter